MSTHHPTEPRWLTADQVAQQVQMHERTIRRACEDGEIPGATMRRGLWRIPADSVDQWMRDSE